MPLPPTSHHPLTPPPPAPPAPSHPPGRGRSVASMRKIVCQERLPYRGQRGSQCTAPAALPRMPPASHTHRANPHRQRTIHNRASARCARCAQAVGKQKFAHRGCPGPDLSVCHRAIRGTPQLSLIKAHQRPRSASPHPNPLTPPPSPPESQTVSGVPGRVCSTPP